MVRPKPRTLDPVSPERWAPHLTMGLRLPKAVVPDYIAALAEVTSPHLTELTVASAAFYQPGLGTELVFYTARTCRGEAPSRGSCDPVRSGRSEAATTTLP